MPIHPFSEEEQAPILNRYNEMMREGDKIQGFLRNYNSGWPLLQVSLFSMAIGTTDPIKYEHVLGGGNCHFFHIGAFNLASLLTKIPGNMDITTPYPKNPKRELVKADNVLLFLKAYSIHHKKFGIKISSKSNAYGKILSVELPMGNSKKLCDELADSLSFALKKRLSIKAIGGMDNPGYTQKQIEEAINPEVAVFINGQIFIDLGIFLEQQVKDKEVIELFKHLFKVDEFSALKKEYAEFKPDSIKGSETIQKTPGFPLEPRTTKPNPSSFFQEAIPPDDLVTHNNSDPQAREVHSYSLTLEPNLSSQR